MQMRCHFIDDGPSHFVQCWVAAAEFPMPDPRSPTWRACLCFHSNLCLGVMEKDSSDLGGAWGAGDHASYLEVGAGVVFRRKLGLTLGFHQCFFVFVFVFWLGCFLYTLNPA